MLCIPMSVFKEKYQSLLLLKLNFRKLERNGGQYGTKTMLKLLMFLHQR